MRLIVLIFLFVFLVFPSTAFGQQKSGSKAKMLQCQAFAASYKKDKFNYQLYVDASNGVKKGSKEYKFYKRAASGYFEAVNIYKSEILKCQKKGLLLKFKF